MKKILKIFLLFVLMASIALVSFYNLWPVRAHIVIEKQGQTVAILSKMRRNELLKNYFLYEKIMDVAEKRGWEIVDEPSQQQLSSLQVFILDLSSLDSEKVFVLKWQREKKFHHTLKIPFDDSFANRIIKKIEKEAALPI